MTTSLVIPTIQVATSKTPDWYYLVDADPETIEGLKTLPGVRLKNGVMQIHRSLVNGNTEFKKVYEDYSTWGTRNRGPVSNKALEVYSKIARPYQTEGADFILARSGGVIADEVGCIDGEAEISYMRAKLVCKIKLKDLFYKFNGGKTRGRVWNPAFETSIKSLFPDGILRHNKIEKVVDSGLKEAVEIVLASGKRLRLTTEHEVAQPSSVFTPVSALNVGDVVLTNGAPCCITCKSTEDIITYPYAKFRGHCRTCMYRQHRAKPTWKGGWRFSKEGYVEICGQYDHPRSRQGGYVYEHILVMEKHIGRYVTEEEHIHHVNEIKNDNRIANLQLLTQKQHHAIHNKFTHMNGGRAGTGGTIIFVPIEDTIVSIKPVGKIHVYDIVMAEPARNFVANKVIVHNCGKTIQGLLAAELSGLKPVLVMGTLLSSGPWCSDTADSKKFCDLNIVHLTGRKAAGPEIFEQPNDGWFFCHYDILEAWLPWIFTKLRPKVAIFDEVHKISPRAKRGRAALAISRFKEMQLRVVISATPVKNKRLDMWMPLELAAPDSNGDMHVWGRRFCGGMHGDYGWRYEGETHNEELKMRMSDMLIRRTKADVMAYLPAIVREGHEIELGMANQEEYNKYKAAERDIRAFLQKFEGKALAPGISGERLIQLGKLLNILSRSKYPATIELAADIATTNGKCVVFCWFKDVARTIATQLRAKDINVYGAITGDDPVKVRLAKAKEFAEDTEPAVYVATLSSASESINELVACQDMVVNDLYWNPQLLIQAEGRLHRSGQKGSVHAVYVTAKNTIDADLLSTLHRKALAIETLGITDDAKGMVMSMGGQAPSDDLDVFIKSVEQQINEGGYGITDEDEDSED